MVSQHDILLIMVEEMSQEPSALMLAFGNIVKTIKDFRAHLGEAEADLTEFDAAVVTFEAQLEAVGVELGQMAASTRDEEGRYIYKELMATEKIIQRQIEEICADQRITAEVRTVMEQSLNELLDEQTELLKSFSSPTKS